MIQIPTIVVRNSHLQSSSSEWSGKHTKVHPNATENESNISNEKPVNQRPFNRKAKSFAAMKFIPKLGHSLDDWIDLPIDHDQKTNIIFNSITLPFKWLLWTSKALAGLPPHQSLRERLCNQSASLGSVAGLFLVIAISAFFIPPTASSDLDKTLVNIYGVLMYFSAMSLTVYICLALTVMYPLLESIPDFAAMEAYQNLAERWGGYELFLFNLGCQSVLLAMIVTAKVVYGWTVLYAILGIFAVLYSFAAFMTREFFIAIDPITTVHMGICNAPQTVARARALVKALKHRHDEFIEDSDNEEEYVATHYMEPQARQFVAQHRAASRLASLSAHNTGNDNNNNDHNHGHSSRKNHSNNNNNNDNGHSSHTNQNSNNTGSNNVHSHNICDAAAMPTIHSARSAGDVEAKDEPVAATNDDHSLQQDANELTYTPKYLVDGNQRYTTIGTTYNSAAAAQPASQQQQETHDFVVTDFNHTDHDTAPLSLPSSQENVPAQTASLESIFLGEQCMLRASGSNMSSADCENVYNILRKQGCRSTEHFVSLLKWRCSDATPSCAANAATGKEHGICIIDTDKFYRVCVDLGIPAFHAMEVVIFMRSSIMKHI